MQKKLHFKKCQPEKTADIWRRYHWFPRQMTSEKRAQKFHTDDSSLSRSGQCSDWLNQISHATRPIKSTTQIWVVSRHQYGISTLVSQTSFGGETNGSVAKCRLFSQANIIKFKEIDAKKLRQEKLSCSRAESLSVRSQRLQCLKAVHEKFSCH